MAGLVIEAIGVVIFTIDVFRANGELLGQLSDLRSQVRRAQARTDRITISDGFAGVDLGQLEIREPPPDPNRRKAALKARRLLWIGAGLLGLGMVAQLIGAVVQVSCEQWRQLFSSARPAIGFSVP